LEVDGVKALVLTLLLATTAGCSDGISTTEPAPPPTWHADVKPLMQRACLDCHVEGGIGPFAFDSYERALALGPALTHAVVSRTMPPWAHDDRCRPALGSMWMSDDEVALFEDWEAADFPEGEAADAPPPADAPQPPPSRPAPDLMLGLQEPFVLDARRTDDYRCFLLDHTFEEETFVSLADIFPGNLEVVHHVIVYKMADTDVPTLEALDAADDRPGFECFSGEGIEEGNYLVGWAPGASHRRSTPEVAARVPVGSRLVMQLHYNVVGAGPDEVITDQTHVGLWTLPAGETPDWIVTSLPIVDFGISLPPGDADITHSVAVRVPVDATIIGVAPHMHLLGTSMRMDLVRSTGARACLADVPRWDFDWQRGYLFAPEHQLELSIDDQLELSCSYDNSAANQPVLNGAVREPELVTWGDDSTDEMCLLTLILLQPYRPTVSPGQCAAFRPCFDACPEGDAFCALSCMGNEGVGCLRCGVDGVFGSCARAACGELAVDFGSCYYQCPLDDGDPYTGITCMKERCHDRFEAYYACLEPLLREGACAEDWTGCGGVLPP
jgi:hypothetical protein